MSKLSTLLPLLLLLSFLGLSSSAELCNANDKKALLEIKTHFNNASVFTTWDPNTDCCANWSGIQCDANGRVTMLAVSIAQDVVGEIPPAMGELPFLQFIAFSDFPNLSGPIPPAIAKLTNLQHLDLSLNNLTGPIPDFLGQLTNLDDLTSPPMALLVRSPLHWAGSLSLELPTLGQTSYQAQSRTP